MIILCKNRYTQSERNQIPDKEIDNIVVFLLQDGVCKYHMHVNTNSYPLFIPQYGGNIILTDVACQDVILAKSGWHMVNTVEIVQNETGDQIYIKLVLLTKCLRKQIEIIYITVNGF